MNAGGDLHEWAWHVEIASTKQIGALRIRVVLVRLSEYADADGIAFPSAETLAAGIPELSRRDVRNAFEALERQCLIQRVPAKRRSATWRLLPAPHVDSGYPQVAGVPATSGATQVAGYVAGYVAGDLAGQPAPKLKEEKEPPSPPRETPPELVASLEGEGVATDDEIRAVVEISSSDPDTKSPVARLVASVEYRRACIAKLRALQKAERERVRDSGPRCEVCGPRYTVAECDDLTARQPGRCDGPARRAQAGDGR